MIRSYRRAVTALAMNSFLIWTNAECSPCGLITAPRNYGSCMPKLQCNAGPANGEEKL